MEIQAANLSVSVYESALVSDGLFFEIYTKLEISQKQAIEITGKGYKNIPSFNYHYVDSKDNEMILERVFDLLFDETAKALWPNSDRESYIDNIRHLGL